MMFEHWCVFLGLVTLVAGGVVKMPEEIPADIAADNTYLYDFAANPALLSDEELKIVALLEMIESKFGTLQENEKDEFVKKISTNYQDRFASTLAKVETIPEMCGLNVDMLRANLGIPDTEEHVEEIHDNFEDVMSGNNIPETNVEDETGAVKGPLKETTFLEAVLSSYEFGAELISNSNYVSPDGSEISILLWFGIYVDIARFDAVAPFHPTAKGVLVEIPRIPNADDTKRKTALLHSLFHFYNSISPEFEYETNVRQLIIGNLGIQSLDKLNSTDMSTPEGVGNFVGQSVAAFASKDGMNCMGDIGSKKYNLKPFVDYTGFTPANTFNNISHPRKWQPGVEQRGSVGFHIASQVFVTPQMALLQPFSVSSVNNFTVRPHGRMGSWQQYKEDTDAVIEAVGSLTDQHKVLSEYFNNKRFVIESLEVHRLRNCGNCGGYETIIATLKHAVATFDAMIAVWKEKTLFNAVRPFTAVRYLYGNKTIKAYSKDMKKVVEDMPASDWEGFLPSANHPEYPSATAAFCGAIAEMMRLETGSDDTNGFAWKVPKDSSFQEEGQPPQDVILAFPTWTNWETECGLSRVWAGTHFEDAVTEGRALGKQFAKTAKDFVEEKINANIS